MKIVAKAILLKMNSKYTNTPKLFDAKAEEKKRTERINVGNQTKTWFFGE